MNQQLAGAPLPIHVDENVLHDLVVVPRVVCGGLICPSRFAGVGVASENCAAPLVVAGTAIRIPPSRIPAAVEEQVRFRVVRHVVPDSSTSQLPLVTSPRRHTQ